MAKNLIQTLQEEALAGIACGHDSFLNEAAKAHHMTGGDIAFWRSTPIAEFQNIGGLLQTSLHLLLQTVWPSIAVP